MFGICYDKNLFAYTDFSTIRLSAIRLYGNCLNVSCLNRNRPDGLLLHPLSSSMLAGCLSIGLLYIKMSLTIKY